MALETTTLFTRKNVVVALAVASVLFLSTGCAPELGGGAGGSGTTPTGTPSNSSSQQAGPLSGVECLPGDWLLDNEHTAAVFQSLSGGLVDNLQGNVGLILRTDGTTTANYDRWTHSVTVEGAVSVVERHGLDQGTWSATDDGKISMKDNEVGSITTMTVNAGGQGISQTIEPEASIFADGDFTCADDILTITVEGQSAVLNRDK